MIAYRKSWLTKNPLVQAYLLSVTRLDARSLSASLRDPGQWVTSRAAYR